MFLNCLEDDFEEANGHLNFPASLPISIRYIVVPRADCHSEPGRLLFGSGSLCSTDIHLSSRSDQAPTAEVRVLASQYVTTHNAYVYVLSA